MFPDIILQDLLLSGHSFQALFGSPDLFLEDLDIALDPAADNTGIGDPAAQGLNTLFECLSFSLELLDPCAQLLTVVSGILKILLGSLLQ